MKPHSKKILGLVALIIGLALGVCGLWLLLSPAQYQAKVRVQVGRDDPGVPNTYFIQTEFEFVRLGAVLSNVVKKLNLAGNWNGQRIGMVAAVHRLKRRTAAQPLRNLPWSYEIRVTDENPETAARAANAMAQAYLDLREKQYIESVHRGVEALQKYYQKEKRDLDVRQKNVEQLKTQLNIPVMEIPDAAVKSNYPAYYEAWRGLTNEEAFHKLLKAKITEEESLIGSGLISNMPVRMLIAARAELPKNPIGPNRTVGRVLLICGLAISVFGFYLLSVTVGTTKTKP